jgi:hypothetical protein
VSNRQQENAKGFAIRLTLSVLLLVGVIPWRAQRNPGTPGREPDKTGLCDLIRNPDRYDGRVVTVSTTLGSGPEGSIFFDDSCKSSVSQPDVIANVAYSKEYNFETKLDKKLRTLLKKSGHAQVTVVGRFIDWKVRGLGSDSCCRYQIEVQQLLAGDPVSRGWRSL